MTNVQGREPARPNGVIAQSGDEGKRWGKVGGVVVVHEVNIGSEKGRKQIKTTLRCKKYVTYKGSGTARAELLRSVKCGG